jgi:hypothetical protein
VSVVCQNPAGDRHEIAEGARKVTLTGTVVWGENDIRAEWTGDYVFCSFGCLAEWATQRAIDHDGVVLREGVEVDQLPQAAVLELAPTPAQPIRPTPEPAA